MTQLQPNLHTHHDDLQRHRLRLTEIYAPETSREAMMIDELALAYQDLEGFEADHKHWMLYEQQHALQAFQRQAADDFLKLQRQWPKAPAAVAPIIGQSLNGALWLVNLWQIIVARLAPQAIGPVPGMDHACQALLAMGFSDKIQNLSNDGWWWASRFLAIQADPEEAIKAWLRKSRTCDKATETDQARRQLYDAPDPTIARQELYDEAVRQAAYWSNQLTQLQAAEPARQAAQLAQARCMGLKTPGLGTCLSNAAKLRGTLQKTIRFIEDRLARFQKEKAAEQRKSNPANPVKKPPEPDPDPEAAIRAELLPRMAASIDPTPVHEVTYIAHAPEPRPCPAPLSKRAKRRVNRVLKELERIDRIAALNR